MTESRSDGRLLAVAEVALAPASFLLHRLTRFVVHRLVRLDSHRHGAQAVKWRTLDGDSTGRPLNRLALMTSAPRWNTHALIALAGPLTVRRTLKIDTATATKSAASWTVVVHTEPAHRIVASIGSLDISDQTPSVSVDLSPGNYRLALRYYGWREPTTLPAVEIDGVPAVDTVVVPADINAFYDGLSQRRSVFYRCLHSYVCTLLRYRSWFPRSFVEHEYLPAGNPQTTFSYGFLPAAHSMRIELDDRLLDHFHVYFTAYNRASLPTMWSALTETSQTIPPSGVSGTYLIRINARAPETPACRPEWVRVHMQDGRETSAREDSIAQTAPA